MTGLSAQQVQRAKDKRKQDKVNAANKLGNAQMAGIVSNYLQKRVPC